MFEKVGVYKQFGTLVASVCKTCAIYFASIY